MSIWLSSGISASISRSKPLDSVEKAHSSHVLPLLQKEDALEKSAQSHPVLLLSPAEHCDLKPNMMGHAVDNGKTIAESYSSIQTEEAIMDENTAEFHAVRNHRLNIRAMHRSRAQNLRTTPVDYDHIIKIMGRWNRWQIRLCIVFAFVLAPHMMNVFLNFYAMYLPKHWCYVKDFDSEKHKSIADMEWNSWEIQDIVAPLEVASDTGKSIRSSCQMYNRANYHHLSHLPYEEALEAIDNHNESIISCNQWMYDHSILRDTVLTRWNIVCANKAWKLLLYVGTSLGGLLGCALGGVFGDRLGRRRTALIFGSFGCVLSFILPFSSDFPCLMIVKFASVICNEALLLVLYVTFIESVVDMDRPLMLTLWQTVVVVCRLLLVLMAYVLNSWTNMQTVIAVFSGISMIILLLAPESPRWLIINSKHSEAESIVRNAFHVSLRTLPADLEIVQHEERPEFLGTMAKWNIMRLTKSVEMTKWLMIIITLWIMAALQEFSFNKQLKHSDDSTARLSSNLHEHALILTVINIFAVVIFFSLTKYFSRNNSLVFLFCMSGMTVAICALPKTTSMRPELVMLVIGYVSTSVSKWLLYLMTVELFPTVIRCSVIGLCAFCSNLCVTIISVVITSTGMEENRIPCICFGLLALVCSAMISYIPMCKENKEPKAARSTFSLHASALKFIEGKFCCGYCPKRWVLAVLCHIGFAIAFGIRCNFGAAKMRMFQHHEDVYRTKNHTNINELELLLQNFLLSGIAGITWFIFWMLLTVPDPADHPTLSDKEKQLILNGKNETRTPVALKLSEIPWKSIFTSAPVWAIIIATFTRCWMMFTLINDQLSYMTEALGLSMDTAITVILSGRLADMLRNKNIFTTTTVRKLFHCSGFAFEALFLIGCAYSTNVIAAVTLMVIARVFSGLAVSGSNVNHLDIAPCYASILTGLGQAFGQISGILTPLLTEYIVSIHEAKGWKLVLLSAAVIHVIGVFFFGIFASGEVQPWATKTLSTAESTEDEAKQSAIETP
ncbi:Vesicular glutamate transporter 2.2 [Trichinella patagoniensis]|uniref:Vesicular glutamate transporter 2.2 n=1 Tax=Trichinella patagoniensis TaxID=990121 RepID=A0A0V0ZTU0_9BILA|nr:Vesicular glutamate transporter 2.2 [Trichinella patagoniensis]